VLKNVACYMLPGRIQAFIPKNIAHIFGITFQRCIQCACFRSSLGAETGHNHAEAARPTKTTEPTAHVDSYNITQPAYSRTHFRGDRHPALSRNSELQKAGISTSTRKPESQRRSTTEARSPQHEHILAWGTMLRMSSKNDSFHCAQMFSGCGVPV
jgi:hypothetical protein